MDTAGVIAAVMAATAEGKRNSQISHEKIVASKEPVLSMHAYSENRQKIISASSI
jgi:hypothetical protein